MNIFVAIPNVQEKCSCYWPKSMNQTMEIGLGLKVTLVEQRAYVEYKLKRIILFNVKSICLFSFCCTMNSSHEAVSLFLYPCTNV